MGCPAAGSLECCRTLGHVSQATQASSITRFDPESFNTFRMIGCRLEERADGGEVCAILRYGLDQLEFEETFTLPARRELSSGGQRGRTIRGLLELLHWVAGVSYYKAAVPATISFEGAAPGPGAVALLEALYSEGLGEFAVVNGLPGLPRPRFLYRPLVDQRPSRAHGASGSSLATPCEGIRPAGVDDAVPAPGVPAPAAPARAVDGAAPALERLLSPVGGGKDSAVAIEIARASGLEVTLFSVGDAAPIRASAHAAGYPRLIASRRIDPRLLAANANGARNGHVPITAIVSCVALLTAALNGQDAVALANERSASAGNLIWHGVQVNHQFSKSLRAERLLAAAVAEIPAAPRIFSLLRPASELSIARAFARQTRYHAAFTSCNRVFALDPARRARSWCCDCDKCRFVYLILAPFLAPPKLTAIFHTDLLADPAQYDGFALLTATGGAKPFECVGEVDECVAAIRLLSESPAWRDRPVVRRLATEVLARHPVSDSDLARHFALSAAHQVPERLMPAVREALEGGAQRCLNVHGGI